MFITYLMNHDRFSAAGVKSPGDIRTNRMTICTCGALPGTQNQVFCGNSSGFPTVFVNDKPVSRIQFNSSGFGIDIINYNAVVCLRLKASARNSNRTQYQRIVAVNFTNNISIAFGIDIYCHIICQNTNRFGFSHSAKRGKVNMTLCAEMPARLL